MSDSSASWFERALRLMPGGVNSPVRSFAAVGGVPPFIRRAHGCHLLDVDDRALIDYVGSWGPMIAGHAHPAVVEALCRAARDGTSFGTPAPQEVELAEEISRRMPSIQKIRMVNSGTEAAMSAIRLARAVTGRHKILKFEGCYHGHADALLVQAGSGVATLRLPSSPGVTPGAVHDTLIAPYNDADAVQQIIDQHGRDIAALLIEPVAGNMGVILPDDGFLELLRDRSRDVGALLIFDEVMTGFRVARGGAQQLYDITPDLTILGKIIGGGLPVGAYGGAAALMDQVAPCGPVYQAGTLSGNPLAMTAGLATLRLLDAQAYEHLEQRGSRLQAGLQDLLDEHHIEATVQRAASMLTVFFGRRQVRCFGDARAADHERFTAFFQAMLDGGVHLPPSGYEAWFLSLAHSDAVIQDTLRIADAALRQVAGR